MVKISVCCLTFKRPKLLGRVIECFLRQTWSNRELVILDDCGDYPDQPHGDRWRIVSQTTRYQSLGAKRNGCASLVSPDTDIIQTWDDDDIYLPWMLESVADVLKTRTEKSVGQGRVETRGIWAQSREVFEWNGESLTRHEAWHRGDPLRMAYHGHWAYRFKEFWEVGGYPAEADDDIIWKKMTAAYGPSQDLLSERFPDPAYVYSREPSVRHLSLLYGVMSPDNAWKNFGESKAALGEIEIGWDREYDKIPRPAKAELIGF